MRHRVAGRKLGRKSDHRRALMRNLSTELFRHERIRTTLAKARELRPYAEKLITMSKRETLHARRIVARDIQDREVVAKMFDSLAPRYSERPGGYTRIMKLGPRRGDNAEMAIIELVDSRFETEDLSSSSSESKKASKKKVSKSSAPKDRKTAAPKRTAKPSGSSKAKAVKKATRRGD